jgi:hypothetical protein
VIFFCGGFSPCDNQEKKLGECLEVNKILLLISTTFLEYNTNTNKATRKKGTMLTCLLGFKQIGQRANEKLA